jgi:hypothetical protein
MSRLPTLPTHARITLEQFLAYTGWDVPSPTYRDNMKVALDFFQDKVPVAVLRQRLADPSPWALPRGGAIKLSEVMQAIDFHRPVARTTLPVNTRLLSFLHRDIGKHDRPRGNYFTYQSSQQTDLAIPHNQQATHVYRVECPVEALKTTVSDAYVDWTRRRAVDPAAPEYRHGGGIQLYIWDPGLYLKHL